VKVREPDEDPPRTEGLLELIERPPIAVPRKRRRAVLSKCAKVCFSEARQAA
jgi:hypothetical protein